MYIPKLHEETDLSVLHGLMRSHPLGTWATQGEGEIIVNHLPLYLDPTRGPLGTLLCHVARNNAVWKQFSKTTESVFAFQGAEAYISPSWYPSKQAHGKVVPTWNYAVVHAHGIPHIMEDNAQLLAHLTVLTAGQEETRTAPWEVSDAPADYLEQMMRQIVGIEIPIAKLYGKWKVSQNRTPADRQGVLAGLKQESDPEAHAMAELVDHAIQKGP